MKKWIFVTVMVLTIGILFCACSQPVPTPTSPTGPQNTNNTTTASPNSTTGTSAADQPENPVVLGGDHSHWVNRQFEAGAVSTEGYYYLTKEGFLYFADRKSGISIRLCSNVACLHEDEPDPMVREECEAFIAGLWQTMPTFFHNDHLYYIAQDGYGIHLWQRNAVGMEERKVASLGTEYTEKQFSIYTGHYAVCGGYLYYDATVSGLEEIEPDTYETVTDGYYIGQVDLTTGKEKILCYSKTEVLTLLACREQGVLLFTTEIPDAEYGTKEFEEQMQNKAHQLRYYDCTTGAFSMLVSKPAKEFNNPTAVIGSKVIYYDQSRDDRCYYYDLSDGSNGLFSELPVVMLTDRYVIRTDPQTHERTVLDLETETALPYTVSHPIKVEDRNGAFLVLSYAEEDEHGDRFRHYLFVEPDALSDGLQLTDGLKFYTLAYDRIS